ncbi:MAG: NUDIX hydrolase [Gammaproteobacteria bacterium]|nr:NUDIX hydrolase [Gammaproteobacteria bacterium]
MKYCTVCGSKTQQLIPDGDERLRHVCTECDNIHYLNPKIITGCLIEHDNKILLCRRAIEPQAGKWTLPAGFMENNETCSEGAARETQEEANASVSGLELYSLYDIPHISHVYMIYRARLASPEYSPGVESLDVQLFDKDNIPWQELAFSVIRQTLISYFNDKKSGDFSLKTGIITAEMKSLLTIKPPGF